MAAKDPLPVVYPKIPHYGPGTPDKSCIAFEKHDGSCLAWQWKPGEGFIAAMTRRHFLQESHPVFGEALQIFKMQFADSLDRLFQKEFSNSPSVVVFAEFFGAKSFAGFHEKKDLKRLVFLDLWVEGLGILSPETYLTILKNFPTPQVIYRGKVTQGSFVENVREGHYSIAEGVVCKGGQTGQVWMCKIKTNKWFNQLKEWSENRPVWIAPDEIKRTWEEEQ